MKKLLVIFLLFFPVYGAWALELICTHRYTSSFDPSGYESMVWKRVIKINTWFKTAYEKSEYHTNGSKWNVITLNDMTIESKHKWKSITKTMTINRTNGNLRTTLQHDVDPVPTTGKGECKKHKKKF